VAQAGCKGVAPGLSCGSDGPHFCGDAGRVGTPWAPTASSSSPTAGEKSLHPAVRLEGGDPRHAQKVAIRIGFAERDKTLGFDASFIADIKGAYEASKGSTAEMEDLISLIDEMLGKKDLDWRSESWSARISFANSPSGMQKPVVEPPRVAASDVRGRTGCRTRRSALSLRVRRNSTRRELNRVNTHRDDQLTRFAATPADSNLDPHDGAHGAAVVAEEFAEQSSHRVLIVRAELRFTLCPRRG